MRHGLCLHPRCPDPRGALPPPDGGDRSGAAGGKPAAPVCSATGRGAALHRRLGVRGGVRARIRGTYPPGSRRCVRRSPAEPRARSPPSRRPPRQRRIARLGMVMTVSARAAAAGIDRSRGARVVPVPPPLYYAAAFLTGKVLHDATVPLAIGVPPTLTVLGFGILAVGGGLCIAGIAEVVRHRTTIVPHSVVSRLVTTG